MNTNRKKLSENPSLLEYLNANCEYADSTEQAEIEALNIEFDDLSGKELTSLDVNEDYEFEKEVYLKLREAEKEAKETDKRYTLAEAIEIMRNAIKEKTE